MQYHAIINNFYDRTGDLDTADQGAFLGGIKWPLYCPQGSGTLRQQLLMIAWYCMVLHGIAWYCMVFHGFAWYCMILHGIALYCTILYHLAPSCTILHHLAPS